jgi:hypothetical protein
MSYLGDIHTWVQTENIEDEVKERISKFSDKLKLKK